MVVTLTQVYSSLATLDMMSMCITKECHFPEQTLGTDLTSELLIFMMYGIWVKFLHLICTILPSPNFAFQASALPLYNSWLVMYVSICITSILL